jgi:hypothetical protein
MKKACLAQLVERNVANVQVAGSNPVARTIDYRTVIEMKQGVERRKMIIEYLSSPGTNIMVNRKYCPLLKYDRDLRYMLKKGQLVRKKYVQSNRVSYTVLVLPL